MKTTKKIQSTNRNSLAWTLLLAFISQSVLSFETGDKFRCDDSVSGHSYTVTVVDTGDNLAKIKVKTPGVTLSYNTVNVIYDENSEGSVFQIMSLDYKTIVETILIPHDFQGYQHFSGTYMDQGDSRNLDCKFLKSSQIKIN